MIEHNLDVAIRQAFPNKVPLYSGVVYDPMTFAPKIGITLVDKDTFKYESFEIFQEVKSDEFDLTPESFDAREQLNEQMWEQYETYVISKLKETFGE